MNESINPVSSLSHKNRIEQEMLHAILVDEAVYPWNPADPATTAYLDQLEATFEPGNLSEDIFESQWRRLSQQAEQLWSSHTNSLAVSLIQKFESRMPIQLLRQLAANVEAATNSGQTLMDQLVNCVQDVVQGWDPEDLRVMARPLAMAMRDGHGEVLEVTLRSIQQTEWDNLSEVEQARLSLAIARYALGEVSQQSES
ncbi:MAG: hypothetical protein F6J95_012450 [Leptolyngbya sp. SIO1E4]|nr:hypothetical protein [Leptolyngbya sp. SIO1E4]